MDGFEEGMSPLFPFSFVSFLLIPPSRPPIFLFLLPVYFCSLEERIWGSGRRTTLTSLVYSTVP